MPRFKITIQYDGSCFRGWQLQNSARTIQGELESALKKLNGGDVTRVHGAGRTDAGVHAIGQVAHFDLITHIDSCELMNALNGNVPEDIKIIDCIVVPQEFHARFSASKRYYYYRIRTDQFFLDRSYTWNTGSLEIALLHSAAKYIIGDHDFTSFSKKNKKFNNRRCNIYESVWNGDNGIVNYYISGNRFLHHMVRYLVGTMVEIARGKFSLEQFKSLLNSPSESVHIFKAPSSGLVLQKVEYND